MDDFSWGETRKVEGTAKDDHGKAEGTFDSSNIYMKRWHEFELERVKRAERFASGEHVDADNKPDYTYGSGNESDYSYEEIEVEVDDNSDDGELTRA